MTPLQIASARGIPGTGAAVVTDAAGISFVLAPHHVVFGGGAAIGDVVWAAAPNARDAQPRAVAVLGHARRGMIGRVTYHGATFFVDCALVEIATRASLPPWLRYMLEEGAWP